jgi:hypothetical protein
LLRAQTVVGDIVTGLFCALATLGVVPIIRCARGGPAEMVSRELETRLREALSQRGALFPPDVAAHLGDLLAARPACVWLQSGIRDDASAERWARAGIKVVQDRCMYVEHAAATR